MPEWMPGAPSGSSPLTRGKTLHAARDVPNARLIPAHAGKTFSEPLRRSRAWAHPRSRVENWRVAACSSLRAGSSPLTRGKPLGDRYPQLEGGLIPAHAGKTGGTRSRWFWSWAHPRSRGENKVIGQGYSGAWGSSPLTRGKPADRALSGKWSGLIPAHAGKTPCGAVNQPPPGAHPRSRGENCS